MQDQTIAEERRKWHHDEPIPHKYVVHELIMWCCVFSRFDLIDTVLDHQDEQTGIGVMLGTAYIINHCLRVTEKYVTLSELKTQYETKQLEVEERAVRLLDTCYVKNYDMCLLLIRWKHEIWGNRTALELADQARLRNFMAHDAVQDLLDKVWFGGLEPTSSYLRIGLCVLCPLLVPFLLTHSKDKMIDRIGYFPSGLCYGYGQEQESDSQMEPSKLHMIMYFVLSPLFCYMIEFGSYVAFLVLFAYVLLRKICMRITFYEYLLVVWMISIQIERIRKFIAIPNKTKSYRFKRMVNDRVNQMYLFSLVTFIIGLVLRGASFLMYKDIFEINVQSFELATGDSKFAYGTDDWKEFRNLTQFSDVKAMLSNNDNPLYTSLTDEAKNFAKDNHQIYPFKFIR